MSYQACQPTVRWFCFYAPINKECEGRIPRYKLWKLGQPAREGQNRGGAAGWALPRWAEQSPGARRSVGSGAGRVGGAVRSGRCDEKRALGQLAAQQPHRTRWQVLQITAAEQSFCLDNVGRAIVHKLVSSTTPACTDNNNPLSVSSFQKQKTATEGGASS